MKHSQRLDIEILRAVQGGASSEVDITHRVNDRMLSDLHPAHVRTHVQMLFRQGLLTGEFLIAPAGVEYLTSCDGLRHA
jgi:hypothetical protein